MTQLSISVFVLLSLMLLFSNVLALPHQHPHSHHFDRHHHFHHDHHLHHPIEQKTTNVTNITNVYIVFVQLWKNEECYDNDAPNCKTVTETVTIHGQWPNYYIDQSGSAYPEYCTNQNLTEDDVSSLEDQLNEVWPTYDSDETNFEFWNHEWTKHGTCWYKMKPTEFFQNGINWHSKYDMAKIISDNDFKTGTRYNYSDINAAFNKGIGKTMYIQCNFSGSNYIDSFFTCFTWDGELMDCPENLAEEANNCADSVEFSSASG